MRTQTTAAVENVKNLVKPDDVLEVEGWDGTYKFKGWAKDGSALLWGGSKGAPSMRNALPEKLKFSDKAAPVTVENTAAPKSRKAGKR